MNDVFRIQLIAELVIGTLVASGVVVALMIGDHRHASPVSRESLSAARRVAFISSGAVAVSIAAVSLGAGSPGFDARLLIPFLGAVAGATAGSLSGRRLNRIAERPNRRRADLEVRPFWAFAPVRTIKTVFALSFLLLLTGGVVLAFAVLQPTYLSVRSGDGPRSFAASGVAPSDLMQAAIIGVAVLALWLGSAGCLRLIALAPLSPAVSERKQSEAERRLLSTVIVRVVGAGVLVMVGLLAQDLGGDLVGSIGYSGAGVSVTLQAPTSGIGLTLHALGSLTAALGLGLGAAGLLSTVRRFNRVKLRALEASA